MDILFLMVLACLVISVGSTSAILYQTYKIKEICKKASNDILG